MKRLLLFLQGAERKNKDESKSAEKRIQKWVKQNTSACAGECLSESFFPIPMLDGAVTNASLVSIFVFNCGVFYMYRILSAISRARL